MGLPWASPLQSMATLFFQVLGSRFFMSALTPNFLLYSTFNPEGMYLKIPSASDHSLPRHPDPCHHHSLLHVVTGSHQAFFLPPLPSGSQLSAQHPNNPLRHQRNPVTLLSNHAMISHHILYNPEALPELCPSPATSQTSLCLHACSLHSRGTGQGVCSHAAPPGMLFPHGSASSPQRPSLAALFTFKDLPNTKTHPSSCDFFLFKMLIANCHNILIKFSSQLE